jgi:hypothetical protein
MEPGAGQQTQTAVQGQGRQTLTAYDESLTSIMSQRQNSFARDSLLQNSQTYSDTFDSESDNQEVSESEDLQSDSGEEEEDRLPEYLNEVDSADELETTVYEDEVDVSMDMTVKSRVICYSDEEELRLSIRWRFRCRFPRCRLSRQPLRPSAGETPHECRHLLLPIPRCL